MENDWVGALEAQMKSDEDEELKNLQKADESRQIILSYWNKLKEILLADIDKINSNETIQKKIGGKIDFLDRLYDGYQIDKHTYPAIYLNISLDLPEIKIKKTTRTLIDPKRFRRRDCEINQEESEEILKLSLSSAELIFTDKEQNSIPFNNLSAYLLRPMLVPHTIVPNFPLPDNEFQDDNYDQDDFTYFESYDHHFYEDDGW